MALLVSGKHAGHTVDKLGFIDVRKCDMEA